MKKKKIKKKSNMIRFPQIASFDQVLMEFLVVGEELGSYRFYHNNKYLGSRLIKNGKYGSDAGSTDKSDIKDRII